MKKELKNKVLQEKKLELRMIYVGKAKDFNLQNIKVKNLPIK